MVDRYDIEPTVGEPSNIEKQETGEFVLYDDYMQLQTELDKARTYTRLEGYPCLLCTYKDGVFVKNCEMHSQIVELQARLDSTAGYL